MEKNTTLEDTVEARGSLRLFRMSLTRREYETLQALSQKSGVPMRAICRRALQGLLRQAEGRYL